MDFGLDLLFQMVFGLDLLFRVDFGLDLLFSSELQARFAFSSPPDHLEWFLSRLAFFSPSLWNVVDVQLNPPQPEPPVQFAEGAIRGK